MLAMRVNALGDDALGVKFRQLDLFRFYWRLFVEHSAKFGFLDNLLEQGELSPVEVLALLCLAQLRQVQRPNPNLCDFEWIKHIHCDSIGALVGEVASDSAAKPFVGLADINGLAVVVVERVHTALAASDGAALIVAALEESGYLLSDGRNVRRQAARRSLTPGRVFCS